MKMKKESKYVRVPTWMMIVFLIFYYLRQRYLVTTDNYDIIICIILPDFQTDTIMAV